MSLLGLGHINMRAPAGMIEHLRQFYVDVVGLREGPRPVFRSGSRGHWLYAGEHDIMHLTVATDIDVAPQHQSCFNHLALDGDDLDAARARLDAASVAYKTDMVDELHQVQLFLTDPAGIGVELTFTDPA